MAIETTLAESLHRIRPDEYRKLVDAGVIDEDARVELLDGLIVDMSPKSRSHENALAWLNRHCILAADPERYEVRIAAPLSLVESEPEPDVSVIERSAARPYHPATAALVIEVAVSSLARDLQTKARIYAQAGVAEYWVVDVEGRRVVVHGEPGAGGYARVDVVGADGELRARCLDGPPLSVGDLLTAAEA